MKERKLQELVSEHKGIVIFIACCLFLCLTLLLFQEKEEHQESFLEINHTIPKNLTKARKRPMGVSFYELKFQHQTLPLKKAIRGAKERLSTVPSK